MIIIYPDKHPAKDLHQLILGTIIPRPIALVSTKSTEGVLNIAPFSYFNAISSVPPIIGFSVSKRKNGNSKDTLTNVRENNECVINLVSYDISRQMALAGIDFPPETDEFIQCGFTPVKSEIVSPPGIHESHIRFECLVDRILNFENGVDLTSLIICKVVCIHYDEKIIDENKKIDPALTGLIGRLGGTKYIRLSEDNIFSIPQSRTNIPVGYAKLPEKILKSKILTGNEIATIAGLEKLPDADYTKNIVAKYNTSYNDIDSIHSIASKLINSGNIEEAAALLLSHL